MTDTESHAAATQRITAHLAERWPHLFNSMKPVPLAIGIHDTLLAAAPDFTADQLKRVLASWCKRPRYLATLTAGAARHGLDGANGQVTEEQAADAAKTLKALLAHFKEKAEAKRQAEQAMIAAAERKAAQAKAKQEAEARKQEEEAKLKAAQAEKAVAKKSNPAGQPAPAVAKPAGPTIIVKKRKFTPPAAS